MRKMFLVGYVILFTVAAPFAASAQTDAQAQATIAAILAQFPNGGPGLADAIAQAVEADPSLAQAAVAAAQTANPAQQAAIGSGLAQAAIFFANAGTSEAAAAGQQIQTALASAPAGTLTAFNAGGGAAALAALVSGSQTLTTNNCVSPNRPGNGC